MKFAVILDVQGRGRAELLEVVADPIPIRITARLSMWLKFMKGKRRHTDLLAIEIDTDEALQ